MLFDLSIVLLYFTAVMVAALRGQSAASMSSEEYFLSSRNLRWYSVAISTIATNVQGYQFLGMMGSAYLYGLAQANLEINAMQGILMAAFIFVPMYLRERVITITQFIKKRMGAIVGLFYSVANLILFATLGLGSALFLGAYAADLVFQDLLEGFLASPMQRVAILIAALGIFSAIYTYFGGLSAVVRTDIIQFAILFIGGIIVLFIAVNHLGGWSQLYEKTPDLMHLHLPADHPKLPWTLVFGLALLNINYWCANQSVVQRSLAARSLRDAQVGLMVGGITKYFMAIIIVVPGIALAGILGDQPLTDPDQTYPYLVREFLPQGLRGLILCALFASLMSTVDSTFNSLATLWSIDIYKTYLNPQASDRQLVSAGRRTIFFTLATGVVMGWVLLYLKLESPQDAITHTLNELRYYINCGIVVIICSAAFLLAPKQKVVILAFLLTIPLNLFLKFWFPEMNYFVRAGWVIITAFSIVAMSSIAQNGLKPWQDIFATHSKTSTRIAWALLLSLILLHIIFH